MTTEDEYRIAEANVSARDRLDEPKRERSALAMIASIFVLVAGSVVLGIFLAIVAGSFFLGVLLAFAWGSPS